MGPLVSTDWLAARLDDPNLRVVDVRWYLDPARQGRAEYERGHIPGAVYLDVEVDLSAPGGRRGGPLGRHPWPGATQVSRVMSRIGVAPGVSVVAYDDQAGSVAARLWYVLRGYGHDAVAVLDGGIVKWSSEGRPLETSVPAPRPAPFAAELRPGWVLTKQEILDRDPTSLVLDARAAERYRGEQEPIDPRAGHIPGARSAPYTANLTAGAVPVFHSPQALRERYSALGAKEKEPIVYCGSGVTACHDLLALEIAGLRGRLYGGSWSEWSADPALPVQTGGG